MFPRKCLRNAEWKKFYSEGEVLRCSKCGSPIAFFYMNQGAIKVYRFEKFEGYKEKLNKMIQDRIAFRGHEGTPIQYFKI